ncbi:hypothetical protein [uncultured Methanoregula sp.]|uniref:hypothetical protein n=1 Tax=uncultured Methanoregula sp. TaxID=1005933 RepID=UPI002AAC2CAB|nr:hypothetical protein [uncultured Methanoregula sp.]
MKLTNTSSRAVVLIMIVVSVIGLIMSPVSAAAAVSLSGTNAGAGTPAGNAAAHHMFNSTQQTARLQAVLVNLSRQDVDVSAAQADIAAGNTSAAARWLMTYSKDHPASKATDSTRQHVVNATAQAERLKNEVTKLSQQGVDVTKVLADLTAGNTPGAMKDLMALHKDRPAPVVNTTQQAQRLQTRITRLAQQGVDVNEVKADLTSGNVKAAMQWMAAYSKAHPPVQSGNGAALRSSNSTQWQKGGSFQPHIPGSGNQTVSHPRLTARQGTPARTSGA